MFRLPPPETGDLILAIFRMTLATGAYVLSRAHMRTHRKHNVPGWAFFALTLMLESMEYLALSGIRFYSSMTHTSPHVMTIALSHTMAIARYAFAYGVYLNVLHGETPFRHVTGYLSSAGFAVAGFRGMWRAPDRTIRTASGWVLARLRALFSGITRIRGNGNGDL